MASQDSQPHHRRHVPAVGHSVGASLRIRNKTRQLIAFRSHKCSNEEALHGRLIREEVGPASVAIKSHQRSVALEEAHQIESQLRERLLRHNIYGSQWTTVHTHSHQSHTQVFADGSVQAVTTAPYVKACECITEGRLEVEKVE